LRDKKTIRLYITQSFSTKKNWSFLNLYLVSELSAQGVFQKILNLLVLANAAAKSVGIFSVFLIAGLVLLVSRTWRENATAVWCYFLGIAAA